MMEITSNWTHIYEPHYTVTVKEGGITMMKSPADANWHDAVAYVRDDAASGAVYVRTADDFHKKFAPTDDRGQVDPR